MEMKSAHLSLDKQDASLKVFPSDLTYTFLFFLIPWLEDAE